MSVLQQCRSVCEGRGDVSAKKEMAESKTSTRKKCSTQMPDIEQAQFRGTMFARPTSLCDLIFIPPELLYGVAVFADVYLSCCSYDNITLSST